MLLTSNSGACGLQLFSFGGLRPLDPHLRTLAVRLPQVPTKFSVILRDISQKI